MLSDYFKNVQEFKLSYDEKFTNLESELQSQFSVFSKDLRDDLRKVQTSNEKEIEEMLNWKDNISTHMGKSHMNEHLQCLCS